MNMEFFEKAHALKSKDNMKKESKSEEKIKKQLKQMLFGYKKSDNELIRNSENVMDDIDDNSVSGFSELNLTNSVSDNESTKATLDSSDLDSVSNLIEDEDVVDSTKVSQVMYSSDKDDSILSRSDDKNVYGRNDREISFETIEESSSLFSGDISIMCSSPESIKESDNSSLFDPEGVLASKIHDKLNKRNSCHDKLKRKFNNNVISINNQSQDTEASIFSPDCEQLNEGKKSKKKHSNSNNYGLNLKNSFPKRHSSSDNQNILYSMTPSPTFVSVSAEDLKTEKFDDIMGHYRYATIKNITEQTSTTLSTFNSYCDWKDENVEINSLTPEFDAERNINNLDLIEPECSLLVQNDSPTLNDDTIQSETISEVDNSVESVEDVERHQVFRGQNCFIVVLKHPARFYIHGKVILKKLAGSAQLYGYNLKDSSYEVYAPFYNFSQCLQTVEDDNDYYGLFNKLTTRGVSVADAENIVTSLGSYDTVVALEKLKHIKIDFVESNFNTVNLFTKPMETLEPIFKTAAEILGCSFYSSKPYKHLEESPDWQEAVQFGLYKKSKGIICGGKGGGKSTLLRYYVNQLLSNGPVLVIDLDPGQCEFTVAGSISATVVSEPLLGPNYTHLRRPEIMLNIGMINTMDNPRRYLTAVDTVFTRCADERLSSMPWIVNTMGMCNAIGLKFITYIILRMQPTFLLQIELQAIKKNFACRLTPQKVDELYDEYRNDRFFVKLNFQEQQKQSYAYIASQAQTYRLNTKTGSDNYTLAPKDERYLNFLAYFGELAQLHKTMGLLGIRPYSVDLRSIYIATNIKVNKESITKVLNGKVVALCQHSTHCDKAAVFILSDKPLLCYGHGIVRGIEKDVIYLITPTSPDKLALVNTILYANWVPELRGQEKNLPDGTVVPYRMQSQYQQKELMFAPRRRFNPLQLLRMSRNS